jgi:hypothetical protein
MDWIFNHLVFVIFAAIVVANLVAKAKRGSAPPPARNVPDTDAAERTRRVQAEIRRKIAERTGRMPVEPPAVPPLPAAAEPRRRNIFQELARQMEEAKKLAELNARMQAAAEAQAQQRVVAEQEDRDVAETRHLAEVQRTLERQQQAAETAVAYSGADVKPAATNARDRLLAALREPASLRRALVLREILGDPVGLR